MAAIDFKTLQGKLKGKVGNALTAEDVQGILDCLEGIVAKLDSLDRFAAQASIHTHVFWIAQGQEYKTMDAQALPLSLPNPADVAPAPTAPAVTLIGPNQKKAGATIRLSRPVKD